MSLQDLQNADEFLEQMLCGLQSGGSWPGISSGGGVSGGGHNNKVTFPWDVDQSNFLATKLQQHQISAGTGDLGIFGTEVVNASSFKSPSGDNPIQALFNGFSGSHQSNQTTEFQYPQAQSFGSPGTGLVNQGPTTIGATAPGSGGGGGSGPPAQPRQRVRARRGQATDPHSIAERLRRERIAERMKSLQELVPNANKTDKASMLDEIIDYVKFLQLQVKVLSMSRLGGAAPVAPPVADISSEGGRDIVQVGGGASSSSNDTMTVAENQVVKLMEEDMGSAMQYLQGKGLCLMPISLATAISTATCHPSSARNKHPLLGGGPSSPNLSGLTVQSVNRVLPHEGISVKDSTSVSKP